MSKTKPTGVEGRASASTGRSMPRLLSIVVLTLAYWAFLSLSIPETNARTGAVKPSVRIRDLSRQSWYHFSNGNKIEGTKRLHEINSIISTNPKLYTPNTKKAFSSLLNELTNSEKRFSIKGYTPKIRDTLISLDPVGAPEGKYNLPGYLATLKVLPSPSATPAQSLAAIASRYDNIQTYVPVTAAPAVHNFAKDFRTGTLSPERWIREEQMSWLLKDTKTYNMISSWLATPKDKHVFVTGSSFDEKFVQTYREQAEADGYKLYFYKDCAPRCSNQAVGAFFATSSTWIHIDSPGAAKSEFIPYEIAEIKEYLGLGTTLHIMDISKIDYSRTGKASMQMTRVYCPRFKNTFLNEPNGCLGNSFRGR